jgi:hypothetical protein
VKGSSWKSFLSALAALSAFVLISCILGGDKVAGRGSEVENEIGVYGVLVDEGGKPVVGATIKAKPAAAGIGKFSAGERAAADSDSVATDAKGKYAFPELDAGKYDLFGSAQSRGLVVLIPEVVVKRAGLKQDLGVDTLRAPGRIQGRMISGTQGVGGVLCYIPGTSFLAVSDDSGKFVISNVPQGIYQVGYSLSGFQIPKDTGIVVLSGRTRVLAPKKVEYDPALAPPAPKGLKAVVDTATGAIRLTWQPVPVSDIAGYIIYRGGPGQWALPEFGHAGEAWFEDWPDVPAGQMRTFSYRVRAIDSGQNLSPVLSDAAIVKDYKGDWINPIMTWIGPKEQILALPESMALIAHFHFPASPQSREFRWVQDSAAVLRSRRFNSVDGFDTLIWKPSLGTARIEARFYDLPGSPPLMSASHSFRFLPKGIRPVDAGRDTTLALGGTAILRGSVDSSFGPVSSWKWSEPSGQLGFSDNSGSVFTLQVPGGRDSIEAVLEARDSAGLTARDTVVVRITRPKGAAWRSVQPDPAFPGRFESALLVFKDRLWVFGGERQEYLFGDEYGSDLADVWSSADGVEWKKATDSAAFGRRVHFASAAFAGKLWLIGGRRRVSAKFFSDIWSSEDGAVWNRVADSLPFPCEQMTRAFVLKDRLWVFTSALTTSLDNPNPYFANREAWSTTDGRTWTKAAVVFPSASWGQVMEHAGGIRMIGDSGKVYASPDGNAWSEIPLPSFGLGRAAIALAPSNGDLYAIGSLTGASALWRIPAAGEAELVQDGLPFSTDRSSAVQLGGRLFVLACGTRESTSVNEVWSLFQ